MRARSITAVACTITLLVAGAGCFKSSTSQASSESSSKSSSSSSDSSGNDKKEHAALERDVRDYTASHAGAVRDVAVLQREIGALADEHGVLDWEADVTLHAAIGRGLAEAGIRGDAARELGAAIVGADGERLAWVLAGQEGVATR
jgi:Flp pilus assembly protein TadD